MIETAIEEAFHKASNAYWESSVLSETSPDRLKAACSAYAAALSALHAKAEVTLEQLQAAHIERQEEWCPDQKPDLSFRGNEMAGEVGEACNIIKKLERERHGWRGSRATKDELADELADVVHTAILCAITAGVDLSAAAIRKFNATSEKNNLATRLSALSSSPLGKGEREAVDNKNSGGNV